MNDHSAQPPAAPRGSALPAAGGWDSGASAVTEPVTADAVRAGDVLVLRDPPGVLARVTAARSTHAGIVVHWTERGGGSRSGVLVRAGASILHRVTGRRHGR